MMVFAVCDGCGEQIEDGSELLYSDTNYRDVFCKCCMERRIGYQKNSDTEYSFEEVADALKVDKLPARSYMDKHINDFGGNNLWKIL